MIERFILTNKSNNKKAVFGMDMDCDYIYKDDGIDWGSATASHSTFAYTNQIGYSISNTKIKTRDISIEGFVFYLLTEEDKVLYPTYEERVNYGISLIEKKKEELNSIVNPLDVLRLTIGEYFIEGKPSKSIEYGRNAQDNNAFFCKFMINIFCNNPMFKQSSNVEAMMSSDVGAFHFPFILTPKAYVLSTRENYLTTVVENKGDVKIGAKFILEASDDIVNPVVENAVTGEKFRINKTMHDGETIIVNTSDGVKEIVGGYNGIYTDYLGYWDFENDWLQFEVGKTPITYSITGVNEKHLKLTIELNFEKYALSNS